jgi:hypothetical protein
MNEKETDKSTKLPGIYRHKDTGVEVTLKTQPKLGTPLINAYIRSGFEYVGPKPVESEVVFEPQVGVDKYIEKVNKNGKPMYYKNGKLISKEEYENNK